jgi:ribose/xylose/arabinose/galactoside ABC-type transport system permease subunit
LPNKERWKMCLCGIYLGIWQLFYGIGWLLYKAVYWAAAIVFCYLWVGLAYAIWYTGKAILWALSFALAFIVNLIIAVHKKERLICGIDGALGGMFAWLYLAPTWSTNLADHLVPILCGMALGAAFGLFNYWVIAVKLLKTLPRERPAPAR